MSIFLMLAFVGLLFKLFVLSHVFNGGKISVLFLSLIVVFALHNAVEAYGYLQFYLNDTAAMKASFRLYYVATTYILLYILLHALSVSKLNGKYLTALLVVVTVLLSGVILFSDQVVAGSVFISYSLTAIKGPFYWIFSMFLIISLISSLIVLIIGKKNVESNLVSNRCKNSLMALMPIISVFLLVVVFKTFDVKINLAGIVPIATSLFLFIVLKNEPEHRLSDIRRFLPFSSERKTSHHFLKLLDDYVKNSNTDNAYKKLQHGLEREIVLYSLNKCNNNVAEAAKLMGIKNRSTLYSMMGRLEIDVIKKIECSNSEPL